MPNNFSSSFRKQQYTMRCNIIYNTARVTGTNTTRNARTARVLKKSKKNVQRASDGRIFFCFSYVSERPRRGTVLSADQSFTRSSAFISVLFPPPSNTSIVGTTVPEGSQTRRGSRNTDRYLKRDSVERRMKQSRYYCIVRALVRAHMCSTRVA